MISAICIGPITPADVVLGENPTRVGLVMDVPDMEAVMAAMETEAAREALANDGVLPETLVFLVEA